jgi:hypothetical protein
MRNSFKLATLQKQSQRQNFRRRQGLMNYDIPVFKKVNSKNLRGIISKKLNKIGKFYQQFQENKIPTNLVPKPKDKDTHLVNKHWHWKDQEEYMDQKNINKLLANTSKDTKEAQRQPAYQQDQEFSGLPLIMSKQILKHKGKVSKELKKRLDAIEQLRNEVSSDLELIQKEQPVFGMNYEKAEVNLPTNIQHRHKR